MRKNNLKVMSLMEPSVVFVNAMFPKINCIAIIVLTPKVRDLFKIFEL
jgi:hypothetical protein